MYGSKKSSTGEDIVADGKSNAILTGERVEGNEITSLEMALDQNDQPVANRAVITFTQKNGAKFTHSFWDSAEKWAIDEVNKTMLHICTKIVSEDEYYDIIEKHADGSFQGWIKTVAEHIIPKAQGVMFSLKIVYKENKTTGKWYANFPKYPNFIEVGGTSPSTLSTNPKYDFYTIPQPTNMVAEEEEEGTVSF